MLLGARYATSDHRLAIGCAMMAAIMILRAITFIA